MDVNVDVDDVDDNNRKLMLLSDSKRRLCGSSTLADDVVCGGDVGGVVGVVGFGDGNDVVDGGR